MLEAISQSPLAGMEPDSAASRIGLEEVRDGRKISLHGPGLSSWLGRHGFSLPQNMYEVARRDDHSIIARTGADEVFIESFSADSEFAMEPAELLASQDGITVIDQQLVTLRLSGEHAHAILAQTCGVDVKCEPTDRIFYTRIAGVSCAMIPQVHDTQRGYLIWVDSSLASYLWRTLIDIGRSVTDH